MDRRWHLRLLLFPKLTARSRMMNVDVARKIVGFQEWLAASASPAAT
jgi:hypothetical protein